MLIVNACKSQIVYSTVTFMDLVLKLLLIKLRLYELLHLVSKPDLILWTFGTDIKWN